MKLVLDPLTATQRIHDEYRRYLRSTFPLRRDEFARSFSAQLNEHFQLARGPLVQASAPYVHGKSVQELVEEGLLADRFLRLKEDEFPTTRPLYKHQEEAIRKAVGHNRNLVVATGTGSGKTECFVLPVLNALMREAEDGTLARPGVRALLLYPMNALANDQLKRLRVLLKSLPAVTFGRYVGETKHTQQQAEEDFRTRHPSEPMLPNELLSRELMQQRPPHILLTNYAMLEYLLLRPEDSSLFDGPTGDHWRFLALDEVHVYGGAQGTEVGMLLRRLRDRVTRGRERGLQCFGTSATLGRGRADYPKLVEFAEALFAEPFVWDEADAARQDVVGPTRQPLVQGADDGELARDVIGDLRRAARSGATGAELADIAGRGAPEGLEPEATLAHLLQNDARLIGLQRRLEDGSVDLQRVARELFPEAARPAEALVDLIDLGVLARFRPDDAPLLPARYHFFLRALEGAFVCLHPEHDAREPALVLSRHEECGACAQHGRVAAMFELGVCRRCGSEYLMGSNKDDKLVQASPTSENPVRALLGEALSDDEDDEDQDVINRASDKAVPVLLCTACGAIGDGRPPSCSCGAPSVRAWLATNQKEDGALRRCIACGNRSGGDPIYRFLTGLDAPVSVVATDLYQAIPPSADPELRHEVGQGRKLLTFSDSRQDAAFFAPFLERTYERAVQRRLIAEALKKFGDEAPRLPDLVSPVIQLAERALVLDPDAGAVANRTAASTWVMREVLALDRRQGLEGTGIAEIRLVFPRRCEPPKGLLQMGFSEDEAMDLLRILLDTVRGAGAVSMLEGVDVRSDDFAPRNRQISIRAQRSGTGILAWVPSKTLNGRLDLLRRTFGARNIDADAGEVLARMWTMLTDKAGPWSKVFNDISHSEGPLWQLSPEWFEVVPRDDSLPMRCSRCHQLWWRSVSGVCPSFRCSGTVEPLEDRAGLDDDHYARLYRELEPVGMAVEEHTAQWASVKASSIQDDFVRGRVNVLSCSTTFELGVDVGDVQAVLLRNVPPSPANYVQRAGRAGRRTDSAALVVTYAQRRNHDLNYFERPAAMVDGTIPAPRVVLDNAPIVRRHLHSLAFAAFQRQVGPHSKVSDFFVPVDGGAGPRADQFIQWLRSHPAAVMDAAKRVVPAELHDALDLDGWGWVDALVSPTDDEPTHGWLHRAQAEIKDDLNVLASLMEEAAEEQQYGYANRLKRIRESLLRRPLLNFLGSRNVLPKYGFPVDVVELNLARSGDDVAANLELNRDLKLAITDYAPGAVTVAGKKQWKSVGLMRRTDREWPTYEWVKCRTCDAFRHGLLEAPAECPSCGSEEHGDHGRFVIPIYGFVGELGATPGETRPRRSSRFESFFGSYKDVPPEFTDVDGLALRRRFSRQGRITVVNKGPLGRGYRICEWCGFGQPIDGTKAPTTHERIDQPGKQCGGRFSFLHLGHEYLTDVLEVQMTTAVDAEDARSALYALLEAAPALDVARDDIDGTLHFGAVGLPSFVLFDAVPGGAGHVQRLGQRLGELIDAASARVAKCECGPETSCYSCLRSYSNQLFHEQLSRAAAASVLKATRSGLEPASR